MAGCQILKKREGSIRRRRSVGNRSPSACCIYQIEVGSLFTTPYFCSKERADQVVIKKTNKPPLFSAILLIFDFQKKRKDGYIYTQ